jgi:hypothetical protein
MLQTHCTSSLFGLNDQQGVPHLGMIPILNAEIGRQHNESSTGPQDDKAYRHALLIIEAKKFSMGIMPKWLPPRLS